MHVTKLKTVNLKGRNLDLYLAPVTVLAGDNFSGKTTVPMALRLGLTGYLPPPIGKTAPAIWALAGDPDKPGTMSVELATDTGRTSKLVFSRSPKGKVSLDGGVPADLALPGLLVEPLTFFGMTGAQRTQAVFEACDPAKIGVTLESVANRILGIQAMPRKDAEATIGMMQEQLAETWGKFSAPAALSAIEALWREDQKSSKDRHAGASAMLSSLATISRDRPGWDRAGYEEVTKELAGMNTNESAEVRRLRSECDKLEETAAEAESDVFAADHAVSQLDELTCCPTCGAKAKGWKDAVTNAAKSKLTEARAEAVKAQAAYASAQAAYEAAKVADGARLAALADRHRLLTEKLVVINQKRGEYAAWEKNIQQRDRAESDVLKYQAAIECYKQGLAIVGEVRAEAIDRVFGEVLRVARGFTDDLLNSPLEFVDGSLGRRVSRTDREDGNTAPVGAWIAHECFSGTEQLLAYAGFAVALSRQSPIKLVVMDELGRLNLQRRVQLIARMAKLVATGVIDQFIGCDVEALDGTAAKYIVL